MKTSRDWWQYLGCAHLLLIFEWCAAGAGEAATVNNPATMSAPATTTKSYSNLLCLGSHHHYDTKLQLENSLNTTKLNQKSHVNPHINDHNSRILALYDSIAKLNSLGINFERQQSLEEWDQSCLACEAIDTNHHSRPSDVHWLHRNPNPITWMERSTWCC